MCGSHQHAIAATAWGETPSPRRRTAAAPQLSISMCKKLPERRVLVLLLRQIDHALRFALRTLLRFPARSPEPHLPVRPARTDFCRQVYHILRLALDARRARPALDAEPLHFVRTARTLAAPGLLGLLRQRPARRIDSVRTASKSKKKPPTSIIPGDDARRWREGVSTRRDAEIDRFTMPSVLQSMQFVLADGPFRLPWSAGGG